MLMTVRRCQGGASRVSRSGEDHTQGEGEADSQRAHALKVAVSQYPVCARAGFYLLTYLLGSAVAGFCRAARWPLPAVPGWPPRDMYMHMYMLYVCAQASASI